MVVGHFTSMDWFRRRDGILVHLCHHSSHVLKVEVVMTNAVDRAIEFAKLAHEGQVRKYTGTPYVTHPIDVAMIVSTVPHTKEMLIAAILHDTVEDTDVVLADIEEEFGIDVANLVCELTDTSTHEDGNRAARKAIDRERLAQASAQAQTIKTADCLHNCGSIKQYDPEFWKVYREEKRLLAQVMKKANPDLMQRLIEVIDS